MIRDPWLDRWLVSTLGLTLLRFVPVIKSAFSSVNRADQCTSRCDVDTLDRKRQRRSIRRERSPSPQRCCDSYRHRQFTRSGPATARTCTVLADGGLGLAPSVFRNQPAYPTNRRDRLTCMAIFAAAATLRCERRRDLNGKDLTFDAGFAVAGVGRNPKTARLS
jgi:hypothetical protein